MQLVRNLVHPFKLRTVNIIRHMYVVVNSHLKLFDILHGHEGGAFNYNSDQFIICTLILYQRTFLQHLRCPNFDAEIKGLKVSAVSIFSLKPNFTSYSCSLSLYSDTGLLNFFCVLPELVSLWTPSSLCLWNIKIPPFNLSLVKPSSRRTAAFVSKTMPSFPFELAALPALDVAQCLSNALSDSH